MHRPKTERGEENREEIFFPLFFFFPFYQRGKNTAVLLGEYKLGHSNLYSSNIFKPTVRYFYTNEFEKQIMIMVVNSAQNLTLLYNCHP